MKPLTFSGVLLVNILVSVFIGYQLDRFLKTTPIFILIGVAYSVFGSIYLLIHRTKEHE
ncbi:AtpZ/AtpI family protein [uncultured Faecalicoccus sp.]|uniref:AtpZ/AtpI family protein n=1 Tax=uncultured Faecalicoccus sp. TaxID=1971760 RepID=UPI00261786F4|nr:AtpZ/AtpI family protein [uncultured Faecalicoccus sp.]